MVASVDQKDVNVGMAQPPDGGGVAKSAVDDHHARARLAPTYERARSDTATNRVDTSFHWPVSYVVVSSPGGGEREATRSLFMGRRLQFSPAAAWMLSTNCSIWGERRRHADAVRPLAHAGAAKQAV